MSDDFFLERLAAIPGFYGDTDVASGAALIKSLESSPNSLISVDEATGMFRCGGTNNVTAEKKDMLMTLYSKTGKTYRKTYAKDATVEVKNPCLTFTGNATPVIFNEITEEDFETGLIPRFEVWCYDGESPYMTINNKVPEDNIFKRFEEIVQPNEIKPDTQGPRDLGLSDEVKEVLQAWSNECIAGKNAEERDGLKAVISRRYEVSLKYAMLHHVSAKGIEGLYDNVSMESLQWGIELSKLLAAWKIDTLACRITTGAFHKDQEIFKEAIAAVKGRRPTFKSLCDRRPALKNWQGEYADKVISQLEQNGEIDVDKTKRLPAYYLSEAIDD